MTGLPPRLTDSSAGTADATGAIEALADGTTYATDVAALRNNLATLAAQHNLLLEVNRDLAARVAALEAEK